MITNIDEATQFAIMGVIADGFVVENKAGGRIYVENNSWTHKTSYGAYYTFNDSEDMLESFAMEVK